MDEPKWTKGPLSYRRAIRQDNTGGYDYAIADSKGHVVAEAFEHVGHENGNDGPYLKFPAEANAALFVAAEDLVEALEECLGALTGGMDGKWSADVDPVEMARAALAKAKGKKET